MSVPSILRASVPVTIAAALEPVVALSDTWMAGQINVETLAAMAAVASLFSLFTWIFNFLLFGVQSRVVRAKTPAEKVRELALGLFYASLSGLLASGVLLTTKSFLLTDIMGLTGQRLDLAGNYFDWRSWSMVPMLLSVTWLSYLRGSGKFKKVLYLSATIAGINVIVSMILVFVIPLGIAGIAIGTLTAWSFGILLSVNTLINLMRQYPGWSSIKLADSLSFGKDAGYIFARTLCLSGSLTLAAALASRLPASSAAAHQVMLQLWLLSSYLLDGIAMTGTTLVGQIRNNRQAVIALSRKFIWLGFVVSIGFSALYFLAGQHIIQPFSDDKDVIEIALTLIGLVAFSQLFNGPVFILDGLLFGLGDFRAVAIRMALITSFIFTPILSYLWMNQQQLESIWWALAAFNLGRFFVFGWRLTSIAKSI